MDPRKIDALVREQGPFVFDRMFGAVEKVRERLERACNALNEAQVPYAVIGGNAVAAWVATRDEGAVRNTRDVDILLDRNDEDAATKALSKVGFERVESMNETMFLDGPDGKPSQAVHVIWAGQKVKEKYPIAAPTADRFVEIDGKRVLDLVELVRMKLVSNLRIDNVHIRDMIGVGLIDESWLWMVEPYLAERLQELLDDPDG